MTKEYVNRVECFGNWYHMNSEAECFGNWYHMNSEVCDTCALQDDCLAFSWELHKKYSCADTIALDDGRLSDNVDYGDDIG